MSGAPADAVHRREIGGPPVADGEHAGRIAGERDGGRGQVGQTLGLGRTRVEPVDQRRKTDGVEHLADAGQRGQGGEPDRCVGLDRLQPVDQAGFGVQRERAAGKIVAAALVGDPPVVVVDAGLLGQHPDHLVAVLGGAELGGHPGRWRVSLEERAHRADDEPRRVRVEQFRHPPGVGLDREVALVAGAVEVQQYHPHRSTPFRRRRSCQPVLGAVARAALASLRPAGCQNDGVAGSGGRRPSRSRVAGVVVVIGAALAILLGFLNWALISNPGSADGTLTGWGGIGGVADMQGQNINDVISDLGGSGSYHPALFSTVLAGGALVAGVVLLWRRFGLAAGVAIGCGVGILGWGVFRALVPGDVAGIVEDGGTRSAIGPWLVAVCGLVIVRRRGGRRAGPTCRAGSDRPVPRHPAALIDRAVASSCPCRTPKRAGPTAPRAIRTRRYSCWTSGSTDLRIGNALIERLFTGCRWAEGPVWFGDHRCLLWSDIPNDRIMRWDEQTGAVSTFRAPANNANGNTRDRQGRLVSCEHLRRRVTRTEPTAPHRPARRLEGRPLNSPNDVVGSAGRRSGSAIRPTDRHDYEVVVRRRSYPGRPNRPVRRGAAEVTGLISQTGWAFTRGGSALRRRLRIDSRRHLCMDVPAEASALGGFRALWPGGYAGSAATTTATSGPPPAADPAPTGCISSPRTPPDRPAPSPRVGREPLLRGAHGQPAVHRREPVDLRGLRRHSRCVSAGRHVMPSGAAPAGSAATDERHFRRHDRHGQHVGVQRQAGQVDQCPADLVDVHRGLRTHVPVGCAVPWVNCRAPAVAALPMSICEQAMSYGRPSSASVLVRPVIACLVAV